VLETVVVRKFNEITPSTSEDELDGLTATKKRCGDYKSNFDITSCVLISFSVDTKDVYSLQVELQKHIVAEAPS